MSKSRSTFNFIEVLTDDKPDTCAIIFQNSTNHIATLPIEHIGYIEIPNTNEKPKYYQVNDINTLIHNVTYTYHPELTEPIPPTNYSIPPEQQSTSSTPFSLHQVYMTNLNPLPTTTYLYNVQPTSSYNVPILHNPEYSLPYRIHQKISNLSTNSTSNSLTLHLVSTKHNLKVAPEKSFFMLLKVKFLGHEIGYNTIKPIHSKIAAIHKIPSPTGKVALMSFIGALNFYSKFIEKLHINLKPFYDLLQENTPWKWTEEHERLFQTLKTSFTSDTALTIPKTKHPFFITVALHSLD